MYNKYSNLPLRSMYNLLIFWESEKTRRMLEELPNVSSHIDDVVVEIKREIRSRSKQPASRIIASWGEYDYWMEVVACPAWVECAEDAEEFFEEELDLPPIRSAYDCTGLAFVSWHKVGLRGGRWVVYVSKGLDV
jgi:hypothetical protein